MSWREVNLQEVMTLDLDRVSIDPGETYEMAGVYSFGKGLFRREPLSGNSSSYKFLYRLRNDHVVLSQLFGWEGALALSSEEFSGLYVSPQFPTFRCIKNRLDRRFLGWLIRMPSFWEQLGRRARGLGVRRRTLNPEAFLASRIPLPPMTEQRYIIEHLDECAVKVEEARKLKEQAQSEVEMLLVAMAHRNDLSQSAKINEGWTEVELGQVLTLVRDRVEVDPEESYPNLGIFSFARGVFGKPAIEGFSTRAKYLYRVQSGQFIYSRLFAFEGAYAMVPKYCDRYFVSNEYPTFQCNPNRVLPEFLYSYFKSPLVWKTLATRSKGLGSRRQRVHPHQLLAQRIMLPPLEWQERIRLVCDRTDELRPLLDGTKSQLEAVMPSILNATFN